MTHKQPQEPPKEMVPCPRCDNGVRNGKACDMCYGAGELPMLTEHEVDKLIRDIKRAAKRMSPPPPLKKVCRHCGHELED